MTKAVGKLIIWKLTIPGTRPFLVNYFDFRRKPYQVNQIEIMRNMHDLPQFRRQTFFVLLAFHFGATFPLERPLASPDRKFWNLRIQQEGLKTTVNLKSRTTTDPGGQRVRFSVQGPFFKNFVFISSLLTQVHGQRIAFV